MNNQTAVKKLQRLHGEFCREASTTATMDSNSFSDFIGWLLRVNKQISEETLRAILKIDESEKSKTN